MSIGTIFTLYKNKFSHGRLNRYTACTRGWKIYVLCEMENMTHIYTYVGTPHSTYVLYHYIRSSLRMFYHWFTSLFSINLCILPPPPSTSPPFCLGPGNKTGSKAVRPRLTKNDWPAARTGPYTPKVSKYTLSNFSRIVRLYIQFASTHSKKK
jgi:hypothetical protein